MGNLFKGLGTSKILKMYQTLPIELDFLKILQGKSVTRYLEVFKSVFSYLVTYSLNWHFSLDSATKGNAVPKEISFHSASALL